MVRNFTVMRRLLTAMAFLAAPVACKAAGKEAAPPSELDKKLAPHYVLEKLKGTVLIVPKGSNKPEAAQEDDIVQSGDEVVTKAGSEASLTLNENTMVHLSANSSLKVGNLSRKSAGGFASRLRLLGGKILAQVEKLTQSRSVFEIESGGVICGVRGTAFEVDMEGSMIQTSTFEGTVEMRKGDKSEEVPADRHSVFAADKGQFLRQRVLNEREKERFRNWAKLRQLVVRRQMERAAALRAFDRLPQTERERMWRKLEGLKAKDRLKTLRRILRERNLRQRLEVKRQSQRDRAEAHKNRQELQRRAAEERAQRLKDAANK